MRPSPAASMMAPWLAALALAASCGTEARGVEDCRAIENARCEAAEACGAIEDASACKRFYRDQCLHGLSVPPPGSPVTDACVGAIDQIAECARPSVDGAPSPCSRFGNPTRACSFVPAPQSLSECNFLNPSVPPSGEGGAGGEPPMSGGTSGDDGEGGTLSGGGALSSGGAPASGGKTTTQGGTSATEGGMSAAEGGNSTAEGGSTSPAEGGSAPVPDEATGGAGGAGGVSAG